MSPIFVLIWGTPEVAARCAAGLGPDDWRLIDARAGDHRLRPLLHARAAGWPVPAEIAARWRESHRRAQGRALAQRVALARIGKAFAAAGVRAAVLKGGAFVWGAGLDPALRPMRDLDLLIDAADAPRAVALLEGLGFTPDPATIGESDKHLPAMRAADGVAVEPHLRLFDRFDRAGAARDAAFVARAWRRAEASVAPGILALGPSDTLLHLILHAVLDHQFNNGPLLLFDLARLIDGGRIDWALFWEEAAALRATRACQLALGVAVAVAGVAVEWRGHAPADLGPDEIARATRLMLVDGHARAALGWPGRLLRVPLRAWPTQARRMLARRRRRATVEAVSAAVGWRGALAQALARYGRARIADALILGLWLKRG